MPEPFTTYKNNVAAAWLWVASDILDLYNATYNLAVYLNVEGNPQSSNQAYVMASRLWDLKNHISGGSPSMRTTFGYCLNWIDDNWPDGVGEIDMSAILKALWDAKPYQTLLFIPMIDAMRGSISEKTVTSQWMADALRHFM